MRSTLFSCFAAAVCILPGLLQAQSPAAGELDLTFSTDGKNIATLPGYTSQAYGADVQADGSVLVAGQAWGGGSNYRMVVARFEPDGDLDTTFGTGGFFTYGPTAGLTYAARAVKVLPNGRIMVAGDYGTTFAALRLLANGTLDDTFSVTTVTAGTNALLTSMAVQADGKILLGGQAARSGFSDLDGLIFRVNANGGGDSSFAASGRFTFGNATDQTVRCLLVQPDGKILYGGTASGTHLNIGRLLTGGTADGTFASGGRMAFTASSSTNESVEALALDSGLNVVAVATNTASDFTLLRLTAQGAMDTYFSQDGYLSSTFGANSGRPTGVAVQPDGRIMVSGQFPSSAETAKIKLRRFEWNGDVDTTFGTYGMVSHEAGTGGTESAVMVMMADRRWVMAGTALNGVFLKGLAALRLHPGDELAVPVVTITGQPQATSVNVGQPVTLTVAVESDVAPVYSWFRGDMLLGRSASPDLTFPAATISLDGNYRVEVRAGSVTKFSDTVKLTVLQPPVVYPTDGLVVATANDAVTLRYSVAGRQPFTARWFKDGQALPISTKYYDSTYQNIASLYFLGISVLEAGEYHVEITNADGVARGLPITVQVVPDPWVATYGNILTALGDDLELYANPRSVLESRLQWSKDGKAIKGANLSVLGLYSVDLSDAGSYSVSIKSLRGAFVSEPTKVGVVDLREHNHIAARGRKFQFTLPAAGPGLTFEWTKDGELLEDQDKATLAFTAIQPGDAGEYVCVVRLGDLELTTEPQIVTVTNTVPSLTAVTLPVGRIGVGYQTVLELPELGSHFEVKGLPAGFAYLKETQRLVGRPTKAGDFSLLITAVNPVGKSAVVKTTLKILPLTDGVAGRFFGPITDTDIEGTFDVTIAPAGTYSGKVSLCTLDGKAGTSTFAGTLVTDEVPVVDGVPMPDTYTAFTNLTVKGLATFPGATLGFIVNPGYLDVQISLVKNEGGEPVGRIYNAGAGSCPWSAKKPLPAASQGVFNLGLSNENYYSYTLPRGHGYARATASAAGVMSVAGKLPDGTTLTSSTPINVDHGAFGSLFLYGNRGFVRYDLNITPGSFGPDYLDAAVTGGLGWRKTAITNKGQKNYPIEFSGGLSVAGGAKYLKPNHPSELVGPLMLGLPEVFGPNVQVETFDVSASGTLGPKHTIAFNSSLEENPQGLKSIAFAPATGLFTGSGTTVFIDERYDRNGDLYYVEVKRPFTVQGITIREPSSLLSSALGYSLVPETYEVMTGPDTSSYIKLNTSYPVSITRLY